MQMCRRLSSLSFTGLITGLQPLSPVYETRLLDLVFTYPFCYVAQQFDFRDISASMSSLVAVVYS